MYLHIHSICENSCKHEWDYGLACQQTVVDNLIKLSAQLQANIQSIQSSLVVVVAEHGGKLRRGGGGNKVEVLMAQGGVVVHT